MPTLSALLPGFNLPSPAARAWMDSQARESDEREAEERRARNIRECAIPPEFADADISLCHPEVQGWVSAAIAGEASSLLLIGPQGTGKTYEACAALREILPYHRGLFTDASEMVLSINATIDARGETVQSASARYTCIPFLVIDDLGIDKPNEWNLSRLFHVIKRRHETRRPTIITTMFPPEQLASRLSLPDEDMRARAIFSRLQEAVRVRFDGPDRRGR